MKLAIGENEAMILEFLSKEGQVRQSLITKGLEIPRGSIGTTLTRMTEKGWLRTETLKDEHPTPVADTYTLYSLSPLGKRALKVWQIYFNG